MREDLHASHHFPPPKPLLPAAPALARRASAPLRYTPISRKKIIAHQEKKMSKEEALKNGKTDTLTEYRDHELWYRTTAGASYSQPANHQRDAEYLKLELAMQLQR
jgi:hypothetical protein